MQHSQAKNWENLSAASSLFYNVNVTDLLCVLVFFVCLGHRCLLYAAFFLVHVNDLPALNRSTIISVLTDLLDGSNYLCSWSAWKARTFFIGSKERKPVDAFGIKCVRAVSLHLVIVSWLAFLFRMNDNSCVFFWSLQVTYFFCYAPQCYILS